MTGINRFDGKDKRRERMRNHMAKDLASTKYRQRVVPNRKHRDEQRDEDDEYTE